MRSLRQAAGVALDPLDQGILQLLRTNARRSLRSLARELGTTTPTVSARVRNLEAAGLLLGYHAEVAQEALPGRSVWVLAQAPPAMVDGLLEAVLERQWVEEAHVLAGGRLLARLRLQDGGATMQDVHAMLAALPGLTSYETHEAIASRRGGRLAVPAPEARQRCHQCGRAIEGEALRAVVGGRRHVFCCIVCRDTFRQRFRRLLDAPAAKG
jgi:DNA-binding Lrp family transcriptional regulator